MLTASDTAYAIAHVRALERDRTDRLFDDPYAAIFADAGRHAREGTERFLALPMFVDGVRLRTRFLDEVVRDALAAGVRQVVLMGAGFDARGHRMPEIEASGARVFEIDLAAQLATKRRLLEAAGVAIPPWIEHVGSDFADSAFDGPLEPALASRGFRNGDGAVFVWEGVIAYISDDAVDRTLRFMAASGEPGEGEAASASTTRRGCSPSPRTSARVGPGSVRSSRPATRRFGDATSRPSPTRIPARFPWVSPTSERRPSGRTC